MKQPMEYLDAGCELATPFILFVMIHQKTRGDPCTTGCAYYENGKCAAYRKLFMPAQTKPNTSTQQHGETVRETAQRLGISISEVRRQRRAP